MVLAFGMTRKDFWFVLGINTPLYFRVGFGESDSSWTSLEQFEFMKKSENLQSPFCISSLFLTFTMRAPAGGLYPFHLVYHFRVPIFPYKLRLEVVES